jgi:hypothetical protein
MWSGSTSAQSATRPGSSWLGVRSGEPSGRLEALLATREHLTLDPTGVLGDAVIRSLRALEPYRKTTLALERRRAHSTRRTGKAKCRQGVWIIYVIRWLAYDASQGRTYYSDSRRNHLRRLRRKDIRIENRLREGRVRPGLDCGLDWRCSSGLEPKELRVIGRRESWHCFRLRKTFCAYDGGLFP